MVKGLVGQGQAKARPDMRFELEMGLQMSGNLTFKHYAKF